MDKRKNNGGHTTAGRKPKAEEVKLIERLTPLEPQAYAALKKGIESKSFGTKTGKKTNLKNNS